MFAVSIRRNAVHELERSSLRSRCQSGKTFTAAARLLEVDDTTVARRLTAMQEKIGVRLYQRLADGTLQLTTSGERAALHAERIEREIGLLAVGLAGADDMVAGTVRVTSVPIIINHVLVPAVEILLKRHPQLRLELIADARDLSLTRREADLALRLARLKTGGTRVTARRIGTIRYEVYVPAACSAAEGKRCPGSLTMRPWPIYRKHGGLPLPPPETMERLPPCA